MLYNYCPFCGVKYQRQRKKIEYPDYFQCKNCGKILYNNPKPAAAGIILNKNKILLTKRKHDPLKGYWDLPGGFVDCGENPYETIKRELKEELNIEVKESVLKDIFNIEYPATKNDNYTLNIITFLITFKNLKSIKAGDDVDDYCFFDKKSLPKKIAFPEQKKYIEKIVS